MQIPSRFDETTEAEQSVRLVVGCCQLVLRRLGRGLTRAAYVNGLVAEMLRRRVPFQSKVTLPIVHRGVRLDGGHFIELCVSGKLLVDILTVEQVQLFHCIALRRRLLLTGIPIGLITTFTPARLVLNRVVVRRAGAFCLSVPGVRIARQSPYRGLPAEPPC